MNETLNEIRSALDRSREAIDSALQSTDRPEERTVRLAKALHLLWPPSSLNICLLGDEGRAHVSVLDQGSNPLGRWAEAFRDELALSGHAEDSWALGLGRQAGALRDEGLDLVAEDIVSSGRRRGLLAMGIRADTPADLAAWIRTLLAACASHLALCLDIEARERDGQALRDQMADLTWLATVGELAGPLAHEFNNFLNVLLLHLAALEYGLSADPRPELAQIRKQGKSAAALIGQWQQYRNRRQSPPRTVDFNKVVREAIESLADATARSRGETRSLVVASGTEGPDRIVVDLKLAAELPPVLASAQVLNRLCTFLVSNAAIVSPDGGRLAVRTLPSGNKVLLQVEDSGPAVAPEGLLQMFEATTASREGTNGLELAACGAIVRRLQGKIHAENRDGEGVVVTVELPAAVS